MYIIYTLEAVNNSSNNPFYKNTPTILKVVSNYESGKKIMEELAQKYIHSQTESGFKIKNLDNNADVIIITNDVYIQKPNMFYGYYLVKNTIELKSFHLEKINDDVQLETPKTISAPPKPVSKPTVVSTVVIYDNMLKDLKQKLPYKFNTTNHNLF